MSIFSRLLSFKREWGGAFFQLWYSPWTSWMGYRYLKSKRGSQFLSFITILSILGVGFGVTAMIVILSVMDGFEGELKKRLLSSELHLLITPDASLKKHHRGYIPVGILDENPAYQALKKDPRVLSLAPVVATEAIMRHARAVTGVELKGVNQEYLDSLKDNLVEMADSQLLIENHGGKEIRYPSVFMGQELAYEMGLIPGDYITLISPVQMQGPFQSIPRMKRFVVEGIYSSGLPEQELKVIFAKDKSVYSFLRKKGIVTHWEVAVKDLYHAVDLRRSITPHLKNFEVKDWVQMNASLFASLRLERLAMFVILTFIIIVASFNIVTTLTLMVLEKKREISIIKAMGASDTQVGAIFLAEGLFIGTIGILMGLILSAVICFALKRYEFITLPDIYYDRTLPVTFDPAYYYTVALCAFVIVLLACFYPSKRAAKMSPLEGIKS